MFPTGVIRLHHQWSVIFFLTHHVVLIILIFDGRASPHSIFDFQQHRWSRCVFVPDSTSFSANFGGGLSLKLLRGNLQETSRNYMKCPKKISNTFIRTIKCTTYRRTGDLLVFCMIFAGIPLKKTFLVNICPWLRCRKQTSMGFQPWLRVDDFGDDSFSPSSCHRWHSRAKRSP